MGKQKIKNKKWSKFRHTIVFAILRFICVPLFKIMYGYKRQKYKLKKNQGYFILSNHQALLDPLFLAMSFKRAIYFVATDNLFNQKFNSFWLKWLVNPIPKRKATVDATCLKNCLKIAKENKTVALFVEGNRAYADFQFYIDPSITKLVKKMNLPLILYNLKGGFGVDPRWGRKNRRGKFTGVVKKELSVEQINELSHEQLYEIICENLKVLDSDSNCNYKSKYRAEYLERVLFVCPKCHKVQTIYTKGEYIYCSDCDLKVEYTENLLLKSNDKDFKFNKLVNWYQFQLDYIKNLDLNKYQENDIIYTDEQVKLYYSNTNKPRTLITQSTMTTTKNYLTIGEHKILIKDIVAASPVGGYKLMISTDDNNYLLKGNERFNPVKYTLILNVLDGPIKERGGDKYYGFSIY